MRSEFSETSVVCYIHDMRFMAQGDLRVTLTVPWEEKHHGVLLSDAYGLALRAHITRDG